MYRGLPTNYNIFIIKFVSKHHAYSIKGIFEPMIILGLVVLYHEILKLLHNLHLSFSLKRLTWYLELYDSVNKFNNKN